MKPIALYLAESLENLVDGDDFLLIHNSADELRRQASFIKELTAKLAEQPAPVQEPVAYLHQCEKKPELRELSFNKHEPLFAAKGYKATALTTPQPKDNQA